MKRLLLTAAAVLAVAAAWGTDLNPVAGRAEATGNQGVYPWNLCPKDLYIIGSALGDMGLVEDAYDGEYWNYADPHNPKRPYLFMFYKFKKPEGYSSGYLRWRIWGNSGLETKLWVWNKTTKVWVELDSVSGTNPGVRTVSGIPVSWFNEDEELYVMATVEEGVTTHNIIADLIDIQW